MYMTNKTWADVQHKHWKAHGNKSIPYRIMLTEKVAWAASTSVSHTYLKSNLVRRALTCWNSVPFTLSAWKSSFIPGQLFIACIASLHSNSLALIGPKIRSKKTVSCGVHLGSRHKLLHLSVICCNLAPDTQDFFKESLLQVSQIFCNLGKLVLGMLQKNFNNSPSLIHMVLLLLNVYGICRSCERSG